ncbi:MAG: UDP-glucose/GDP-mannose dehydrogenase family protein [Rhizobiaceae bacterium]
MRITVIGSGYVGLVTGACIAELGHQVICVDKDAAKIAALKKGQIPIYEPGLSELVANNTRDGRLSFATNLRDALPRCDMAFIAVGTPPRPEDGVADMRFVLAAAAEVAQTITGPLVLVTKSTVPVGTSDRIERVVQKMARGIPVDIVSNPEFLREGDAIADFMHPDRIVVGCKSNSAASSMRALYAPLIAKGIPLLTTSRQTAELIKYASNAFLAMKVTFINEMADLCEHTGADVDDIALGMGLDQRIGSKFLRAGPGFGGSCFPKDILALLKSANDAGTSMRLVENTIAVNEARKRAMARKIADALDGDIVGKRIAVLGLTFKPGTDDVRDTPALTIIRALQDQGAVVRAFDPKAGAEAKRIFNGIELCASALGAAKDADAVVLITEWPEFKLLVPRDLAGQMRGRVLVDLRNALDQEAYTNAGFSVHRVGQPSAYPEGAAWLQLPAWRTFSRDLPQTGPAFENGRIAL